MKSAARAAFLATLAILAGTLPALETVAGARPPSKAAADAASGLEKTLIECIRKAVPSYVFIGGGSGVIISEDGLMLTNHHVAGASKRWKVRLAGEKQFRDATVLGYDPVGDVSLLKIQADTKLPYAELGVSDKLETGTQVVAIGNPFALADIDGQPAVSFGIVSAVKSYQQNYFDTVWTDAAVNPGNSGGPLLTLDGKLVGINGRIDTRFMTRSNTGIGFAISIDQIKRFLPLLKDAGGKAIMHGRIQGLELEVPDRAGMSPFEWQNRVLSGPSIVKSAQTATTAATAGFHPGDRIAAIDQYAIFNRARFDSVLGAYPAGHKVVFSVKRPQPMPSTHEDDVKIEVTLDGQKNLGLGCQVTMAPAMVPDVGRVTGLVVVQVPVDGAARKAGIEPGDYIVAIAGRKLESPDIIRDIFNKLAEERNVGDVVKVDIFRGRTRKSLTLDLPLSLAFE